jgi:hypothetical protein
MREARRWPRLARCIWEGTPALRPHYGAEEAEWDVRADAGAVAV